MTAAIVTYAQAKSHLRLPDDREQTAVEEKTQQATAFVLRYIGREKNDWTPTTDPNVDLDFAIVQGAILALLGESGATASRTTRSRKPPIRWRARSCVRTSGNVCNFCGGRRLPDPIARRWPDATIVCVASGPTLTADDLAQVRGRAPVVAVNDAIRLAPWADVLYSSDRTWWRYYDGLRAYQGAKVGIGWKVGDASPIWRFPAVHVLTHTGADGLEESPTGLRTGGHSGFAAINLAVHLGARRIVLLGYTGGPVGGRTHFFGRHPSGLAESTTENYAAFRRAVLLDARAARGPRHLRRQRHALELDHRVPVRAAGGRARARGGVRMITVVCWRWRAPWRYRSTYAPATVHTLRRMVADHYQAPHRFVCVTDDPRGLEGIETIPIWRQGISIRPPEGMNWPSCYVRLRAFAAEARDWFGDRYVSLDLDTVITGDLAPLFERPEDFVIWNETDWPGVQHYNASIWLHTPGTRTQIWDTFDLVKSPRVAFKAGGRGGDQAWISHVLGPGEAVYTPEDGVLSYRRHIVPNAGRLPAHARIVNFHGQVDPWSPAAQELPWVREHYGAIAFPQARGSALPPRPPGEAHR